MATTSNRPIYGIRATEAVFKKRPQEIRKVYVGKPLVKYFSPLLKYCADKKLPYKIADHAELDKVSKSTHHEGICIITRDKNTIAFNDFLRIVETDKTIGSILVYLDGVENPHNLGSIVRITAFFGIRYIMSKDSESLRLSGAVCRIAEGGAEACDLVTLSTPVADLNKLKKQGYKLIATSAKGKTDLFKLKTKEKEKIVLILGSEGRGVSNEILKVADAVVNIPGSGAVSSLNVASATAVCLSRLLSK